MDIIKEIVILMFCLKSLSGQTCTSGTTTGSNSLLKKNSKVDSNTAETFVHTDSQYFFKCCGVVEQWKLYAENPGNVNLQVWRPVGSTLKLIGQNTFYIASEGTKTIPVPVSERITVQYADYIGWFSDSEMITYSDGSASDTYSLAITYDTAFYSGGNVGNWGSANIHSNRLYAVIAILTASSAPTLSDLSIPREFFQHSLHVGATVLVAHTYDVDTRDLEYMTFTRIDAHDHYFEMIIEQNSSDAHVAFRILNIPPNGNYNIQFEAKDSCFNTIIGSAEIVIKRRDIAIKSLPNVVTTHLQKPSPLPLHKLIVQSDALFGCTISSVTPTVPPGLIIIDTSDISVIAPSVLSAPETYKIGVTCADSEGTEDTQTLTVNTIVNTAPRVDGFVDSVFVDVLQTSVNDVVHTYVIVDDESDDVDVLSFCDQNPCPFKLLISGDVICTNELNGLNETTYTIHFGLSDGNKVSDEYIFNIYLQNFNVVPHISNLLLRTGNTITVAEATAVGSQVFDVDGLDENPLDVLLYNFIYDPPEGANFFAHSTKDGTLVLISPLNYTVLQSSGFDKFGVKVNVTDGKLVSSDYYLTIVIIPGSVSSTGSSGSSDSSGAISSSSQQTDFNITNIVLAAALGVFTTMSLAMCILLMMKKTRTYSEDINSSTADLISIHSRFRVVQVEPSYGKEHNVKISKPKMTPVE